MRFVRALLLGVAACAVLTVTIVAGVPWAFGDADPRRAPAYRQPCGFSHDGWFGPAYYTYCGARGSRVEITVEHSSTRDTHRCVGTGVTRLGTYPAVHYAYYNGRRC